jgi:hypothetical protein
MASNDYPFTYSITVGTEFDINLAEVSTLRKGYIKEAEKEVNFMGMGGASVKVIGYYAASISKLTSVSFKMEKFETSNITCHNQVLWQFIVEFEGNCATKVYTTDYASSPSKSSYPKCLGGEFVNGTWNKCTDGSPSV